MNTYDHKQTLRELALQIAELYKRWPEDVQEDSRDGLLEKDLKVMRLYFHELENALKTWGI